MSNRSLPTRERGLKSEAGPPAGRCSWSLPTRERGLKSVLPFIPGIGFQSLPTRERGLKYEYPRRHQDDDEVAPYAGAWIEIGGQPCGLLPADVAPYAGAWIEMLDLLPRSHLRKCRSLRGSVD